MDKIKIVEPKVSSKLGEISNNFHFHLMDNKTYEPLTVRCKCKDFFQDALWAEKTKNDVIDKYGFTWKQGTYDFFNKSSFVFGIREIASKDLGKYAKETEALYNIFDEALGIEPDKYTIVTSDETDDYLIVITDTKWIERPYLSSLLFMLARIGKYYQNEPILEFFKKIKDNNKILNDASYVRSIYTKLENILKGYEYSQNWEDYSNVNMVHSYSGIVGLKSNLLIKNAVEHV